MWQVLPVGNTHAHKQEGGNSHTDTLANVFISTDMYETIYFHKNKHTLSQLILRCTSFASIFPCMFVWLLTLSWIAGDCACTRQLWCSVVFSLTSAHCASLPARFLTHAVVCSHQPCSALAATDKKPFISPPASSSALPPSFSAHGDAIELAEWARVEVQPLERGRWALEMSLCAPSHPSVPYVHWQEAQTKSDACQESFHTTTPRPPCYLTWENPHCNSISQEEKQKATGHSLHWRLTSISPWVCSPSIPIKLHWI